jgi:hypothetical protein
MRVLYKDIFLTFTTEHFSKIGEVIDVIHDRYDFGWYHAPNERICSSWHTDWLNLNVEYDPREVRNWIKHYYDELELKENNNEISML